MGGSDVEPVITLDNWQSHVPSTHGRGLVPRDRQSFPNGCFAWAEPFPDELLVPEDEIQDRIDAMTADKQRLLDLREKFYEVLKSLDQDGLGLCWAFSTTKANMYLRAIMRLPLLRLSAWWVAGKVKGWRDQGGWGGESLAYEVKYGVPEMHFCPDYHSKHDTPECNNNAALHKVVEWWEGSDDPDKALHQKFSAHLMGLPTVDDYDFLRHSMCGVWCKKWRGEPEVVEDNSWGEDQGDKGLYTIKGKACRPNGLWIPRVTSPSIV